MTALAIQLLTVLSLRKAAGFERDINNAGIFVIHTSKYTFVLVKSSQIHDLFTISNKNLEFI
jgi:hypothetical protein